MNRGHAHARKRGDKQCHRREGLSDRETHGAIVNPTRGLSIGVALRQASARWAAEHLGAVPLGVIHCNGRSAALRADQRRSVIVENQPIDLGGAVHVLRNEYRSIVVERDRAAIEDAMVKGTQREPVFLTVRPVVGVPAHVRGFEAKVARAEPALVAADRAAMFVDAQDRGAKGGVATAARGGCGGSVGFPHRLGLRHADGEQDVLVQGRREVVVKQDLRGPECDLRVGV
jgi:hypothetical protein